MKNTIAFAKKFFLTITLSFFCLMNSCKKNEKNFQVESVPKEFEFIDAGGGPHKTLLYEHVEKHDFDSANFVASGSRMKYVGEGYVSKQGIDISHHDGEVDWKKVKAWGAEFVILRVGYMGYKTGEIHEDKLFQKNAKDALEAGLEVGAYFFSQAVNEEEALQEAQFVLQEIKDCKITLPVVYDPESILYDDARTDDVSKEQFTKNTLAFCNAIQEAGYTPMIYMNMMWQAYNLNLEELSDFLFWYADYEKAPQTPYKFSFWQYSCMGIVDGIDIPKQKTCLVDMNIMMVKNQEKK